MSGFQIILGERWSRDRAIVEEMRAGAAGGTAFDFTHVLDVMDIFIDGANVGAVASADAIACLTRDLLGALAQIAAGRARKAIVTFYESPFELVLQAAGGGQPRRRSGGAAAAVLVTFLRGGPSPDVLVHNREVHLTDVARAAAAAARRLAGQIVRVHRSLASDAFVLDLRRLADEVSSAVRGASLAIVDAAPVAIESRDWDRGVGRRGVSLAFRAEACRHDLLGPVLPDRADLSALLFRGEVAVWAGGRRRSLGRCYPFLVCERLLGLSRHALEAHDGGCAPGSLRVQCDGLLLGLRPEGEGLVLTAAQRGDDVEPVQAPLAGAAELAEAVVDLAAEIRRSVLAAAPGQKGNLRFDAFCSDLRFVDAWRRDLHAKAIVNRDPDPYRVVAPEATDDAGGDGAPLLLGEPRRMRYAQRWHLEAEGLDLFSTFLCGDRLVVSTAEALLAVDRDSGEVIWRLSPQPLPADAGSAASIAAGSRGLARASADGRVVMLDLSTGAQVWSARVQPRVGRPAGIAVGPGRTPRLLVLAEGTGPGRRLVALDVHTGEQRWRFSARRGGAPGDGFEFVRAGRLLVVACGDASIYAIDSDIGAVVWRFGGAGGDLGRAGPRPDPRAPTPDPRLRGRFVLRPVCERDRIAAVAGEPGRRGASLHLLDAFTGGLLWSRPLPGAPLAGPALCGNVALVATCDPGGAGRPGITAIETATGVPLWRRTVPGLDRGFAWLPVDDRIVVNVAGGHAVALHAPTGDVAWEMRPGLDSPRDVPARLEPVLRGGALFLPAAAVHVVRPDDGEVIHRLDDGPVPDYLRVDERCHLYVGEHSGHMSAFDLVARLAVVK